jgi:hypothetical protein
VVEVDAHKAIHTMVAVNDVGAKLGEDGCGAYRGSPSSAGVGTQHLRCRHHLGGGSRTSRIAAP